MLNLQAMFNTFIDAKVLTTLGTALGLILIDVLLGIFLSIRQGSFDFQKLPQFLSRSVLSYVGPLLMLALFTGSIPAIAAVFYTSAATVVAKFLADIKDKLVGLNLSEAKPSSVPLTGIEPAPNVDDSSPDTPFVTQTVPGESKDGL